MHALTKRQQRMLVRIGAAAVLLCAVRGLCAVTDPPLWTAAALYLVPYLTAGWDVLWKALRNIRNGQVFDENFLMSLATVGAFATGEYAEAVFVMLFYQVGEWFQSYAVGRSRQSIAELMDIRPDTANVEQADGSVEEMDPEDVEPGAVIVVRPGERVPLDGVVLEGRASLDTAALTGESLPRDVGPGDPVISGCVDQTGLLRVEVTRSCDESTVSRILDLVEEAGERKAVSEQSITRFARWYTPCVVIAALILALVPPLIVGGWGQWLHRALIFLVVSCPCALVISVPLSFFGGIGGASRRGILVKGGVYLETLARADTVVFDKTGTLTQGRFTVTDTEAAEGSSPEAVLAAAALAESWSSHPIALSLREAYRPWRDGPTVETAVPGGTLVINGNGTPPVTDVEELAGHGVRASVGGRRVCVGNRRLMEREGLTVPAERPGALTVYVSIDGAYAGRVTLADLVKPDARDAVSELGRLGVRRTVLLTGDGDAAAKAAAEEIGVDEWHASLLPEDKVARIEALTAGARPGTAVAFVGDGINDAPVLSRADVGIAMGALGSDAAIEAADVVLMDDRPSKIAEAVRIARKTVRIVRENIVFALTVKFLVLILAAMGKAAMWAAVFADVGVAFLAILNAMRCLRVDGAR